MKELKILIVCLALLNPSWGILALAVLGVIAL